MLYIKTMPLFLCTEVVLQKANFQNLSLVGLFKNKNRETGTYNIKEWVIVILQLCRLESSVLTE